VKELKRELNTKELLDSFDKEMFLDVYRSLGGQKAFPEMVFTMPFMEFGRFCVLLDEPIHFNRYRAKTLRSVFYENLNSFPLMKYRTYCRKYETECLKAGTSNPFWTNSLAEQHFGPSQASGDLGLRGSSGWKLTALKDFSIDLIARQRKIRLLRMSVWDDMMVNMSLKKLNDILISPGKQEVDLINKFVERKVVGLYADDF
jgi:hypothetical protein